MLIQRPRDYLSSEITPRHVFQQRRQLLRAAGSLGLAGLLGAARAPAALASTAEPHKLNGAASPLSATEPLTSYQSVTGYNNFYEFGSDKTDPKRNAGKLMTRPWTVRVEGLVTQPRTFDIDDLLQLAPLEERIYRLRCVEGWSMVIPWLGYPLSALLNKVQPLGSARFVEFTSLYDPEIMTRRAILPWPYTEGLRLDEAMHPLTILAVGVYGEVLPNQNGAPIRLVVPWKYGFKSAKSLVTIRLVEKQPVSTWERVAPHEYGFYANVNPDVSHPRWSQASERRIGELRRRPTQLFNGYAEQVASLYTGLDLKRNY
jgi:sulfoxide reductase catalytic subunit YedY